MIGIIETNNELGSGRTKEGRGEARGEARSDTRKERPKEPKEPREDKRKVNVYAELFRFFSSLDNQSAYFGGPLEMNAVNSEITIGRKEANIDHLVDEARLRLEGTNSVEMLYRVLTHVARNNSYDPFREYMDALVWDGKKRLSKASGKLYQVYGQAHEVFNTYLTKWLVGAVQRVYEPGSPFQHILILSGPQGIGKSTFFQVLAGANWFLGDKFDLTSNDDLMKLPGKLIVELAELASFAKRENEIIKRFITTDKDEYRKPYDRGITKIPRRCVFGGTTNKDDILTDETGNRRYWIIPVSSINLDLLRNTRDQLWAEAVALYKAGYSVLLSPDDMALTNDLNRRYETTSPWEEDISAFLSCHDKATLSEVMEALGISRENYPRHQYLVSKVLIQLGWEKRNNGRQRYWVKKGS